MRLDDMDTSDVEVDDQRGSGGGRFGFPMGGGALPLGRSMGCGTLALVIVIALVFGVNPMQILGVDPGGLPTQVAPQDQAAPAGQTTAVAASRQRSGPSRPAC